MTIRSGRLTKKTNKRQMVFSKVATAIGAFVVKSFDTPVKWIAGLIGMTWAAIEPTIPFIAICYFFVFIDCISAWRLSKRVMRYFPEQSRGSEFRSEYANKIFDTLSIITFLVMGCFWLDENILVMFKINLGNWVAGAFCAVQLISILENSSSCNGATWAVVVQHVLVDKTSRHLKFDIGKLVKEAKEEQKKKDEELEEQKRKDAYKERARKAAETRRKNQTQPSTPHRKKRTEA